MVCMLKIAQKKKKKDRKIYALVHLNPQIAHCICVGCFKMLKGFQENKLNNPRCPVCRSKEYTVLEIDCNEMKKYALMKSKDKRYIRFVNGYAKGVRMDSAEDIELFLYIVAKARKSQINPELFSKHARKLIKSIENQRKHRPSSSSSSPSSSSSSSNESDAEYIHEYEPTGEESSDEPDFVSENESE